ncbi:hypothetical protein MTO96_027174 [Rhipicephalus appendiculatus]
MHHSPDNGRRHGMAARPPGVLNWELTDNDDGFLRVKPESSCRAASRNPRRVTKRRALRCVRIGYDGGSRRTTQETPRVGWRPTESRELELKKMARLKEKN